MNIIEKPEPTAETRIDLRKTLEDLSARYELTPTHTGSLKTPKCEEKVELNGAEHYVKVVNRDFSQSGRPLIITEVDIKSNTPGELRIYESSFILSNGILNEVYKCEKGWDLVLDVLKAA